MNSHWNAAGWISHAMASKPIGNKYFSCSTLYRSRSLPSQCKLHIFLIYWILSYTIQQLSFIAYMLQHAKVASWVLCWNVNFVDLMNYTRMHNEEWELTSTLRYKKNSSHARPNTLPINFLRLYFKTPCKSRYFSILLQFYFFLFNKHNISTWILLYVLLRSNSYSYYLINESSRSFPFHFHAVPCE